MPVKSVVIDSVAPNTVTNEELKQAPESVNLVKEKRWKCEILLVY